MSDLIQLAAITMGASGLGSVATIVVAWLRSRRRPVRRSGAKVEIKTSDGRELRLELGPGTPNKETTAAIMHLLERARDDDVAPPSATD